MRKLNPQTHLKELEEVLVNIGFPGLAGGLGWDMVNCNFNKRHRGVLSADASGEK